MAGFVRGKQAGIQNDLSASIRPELFTPDDQARYGINSQIRFDWLRALTLLQVPAFEPHLPCRNEDVFLIFCS